MELVVVVGEVGGMKEELVLLSCGDAEMTAVSEGGMGGEEAARALNIPFASFLPSCGSTVWVGGALFRAKNRLTDGEELSIVVFGLDKFDTLELAFVTALERDQKDEKKVEEGVDELAVADERVGESIVAEAAGADKLFVDVAC